MKKKLHQYFLMAITVLLFIDSLLIYINLYYTFDLKEYSNLPYQLFLLMGFIGGVILLSGSLALLFVKTWGRFFGIISLIFALFIHAAQIYIEYRLEWAITMIFCSVSGIYYLSRPTVEHYFETYQPFFQKYLNLFSQPIKEKDEKKGLQTIKILSIFLLVGGFSSMILGIMLLFMLSALSPFLFSVILLLTLLLTFSFFSLALFIHEKDAELFPYIFFFLSLLFVLNFYHGLVWSSLYFKQIFSALSNLVLLLSYYILDFLSSLLLIIQNDLYSIKPFEWLISLINIAKSDLTVINQLSQLEIMLQLFYLFDLSYLLLCFFIVGYGFNTFLANKKVLTLLYFEKENKKKLILR